MDQISVPHEINRDQSLTSAILIRDGNHVEPAAIRIIVRKAVVVLQTRRALFPIAYLCRAYACRVRRADVDGTGNGNLRVNRANSNQ
jgi:hypothetical protein